MGRSRPPPPVAELYAGGAGKCPPMTRGRPCRSAASLRDSSLCPVCVCLAAAFLPVPFPPPPGWCCYSVIRKIDLSSTRLAPHFNSVPRVLLSRPKNILPLPYPHIQRWVLQALNHRSWPHTLTVWRGLPPVSLISTWDVRNRSFWPSSSILLPVVKKTRIPTRRFLISALQKMVPQTVLALVLPVPAIWTTSSAPCPAGSLSWAVPANIKWP